MALITHYVMSSDGEGEDAEAMKCHVWFTCYLPETPSLPLRSKVQQQYVLIKVVKGRDEFISLTRNWVKVRAVVLDIFRACL